MNRRHVSFAFLILLLGFVITGCGASAVAEYPAVSGRRVLSTKVVSDGAVAYQVGAYELVFAQAPGASRHARRAALLVDLVGGQGHVQGFAEWGRPGETPRTYAVGGWARQRTVEGDLTTVFELALNYLEPRGASRVRRDPQDPIAVALRVVVNESSGDVTLMRR
jgi:hypothetical protein